MGEEELYKPIQEWLRKFGYESRDIWKNRGIREYQIDVVGLRRVGSRICDNVEIVAVEVKLEGNYQSLAQADTYRDVAHRVYFATAAKNKIAKFKEYCIRKNLGLLFVNKDEGNKIEECCPSPVIKPRNEDAMLMFLENIRIFRCTLCQCYFDFSGEEIRFVRKKQYGGPTSRIIRYLCKHCKEDIMERFKKIEEKCSLKENQLQKEILQKKIYEVNEKCSGRNRSLNLRINILDKKYRRWWDLLWRNSKKYKKSIDDKYRLLEEEIKILKKEIKGMKKN